MLDSSSRRLLAAILVCGVVVPGLIDHALVGAGYVNLGRAVWVIGYGTAVFAAWYGWVRPLDITGPSG